MKRIVVCAVAVAAVVSGGSAGAAQNDRFGVSPSPDRFAGKARRALDVPREGGASLRDGVRLWNLTGARLTLSIYAARAVAQPDGVIAIASRSSHRTGLAAKLEPTRTSVVLGPHASATVPVVIHDPGSILRTDLAALAVEEAPAPGTAGIDVVQRIAVLVRPVPPGTPTPAQREAADPLRWILYAAAGAILLAGALAIRGRRKAARATVADTCTEPVAVAQPELVAEREIAEERPLVTERELVSVAASRASAPQKTTSPAASRPRRRAQPRRPRALNYIPLDPSDSAASAAE
jgi:hypothetical protein